MKDKYPKEKYGSETVIEVDTATGNAVGVQDDVYNGGVTRRLRISEDSVKIDDEKMIIEKVFELYKQQRDGRILGFSVNAEHYDPKTFALKRIVIRSISLEKK